ncbi:unnamed protein product [Medioppia subpectinata]|uniref:ubiquitinyl hydrolase 1 n=1 Tax=Medioppia subpectinata TaxID=1979941 RepID=A0A7R9KFY0_9ACAR|nr:unnamed protein product [Medioppia subpectinata]CAG2101463.1 unnamed protein product [Medioppia subpectinata]
MTLMAGVQCVVDISHESADTTATAPIGGSATTSSTPSTSTSSSSSSSSSPLGVTCLKTGTTASAAINGAVDDWPDIDGYGGDKDVMTAATCVGGNGSAISGSGTAADIIDDDLLLQPFTGAEDNNNHSLPTLDDDDDCLSWPAVIALPGPVSATTTSTSGQQHQNTVGVGLANLGNTCYQNCVFQCLLNNRHFVQHLTPSIRESMSRRHKALADGRQHDAQEFLALLLDALHEQLLTRNGHHCDDDDYTADGINNSGGDHLNSISNHNHNLNHNSSNSDNHRNSNHVTVNVNKRLKVSDKCCTGDDEPSSAVTINDTTAIGGDKSCVQDVFQGQLCSRIVCDVCHRISQTYEAFMYLALPLPIVRHRQLVVAYTPLAGPTTRLLITVENKYDSVVQIKHRVREQLALNAVTDSELVVAETHDGGTHVARLVDDSEDVLSLNTGGGAAADILPTAAPTDVTLFQLNEALETVADGIDTSAQCVICLEDKPIRSLLSHTKCPGVVCEPCLDTAMKHYANDCPLTTFTCFSCARDVTKCQFAESRPLANRNFCVPLVFRADGRLVYGVRLLRVSQQMDANTLYALVDSRVPNPEYTYRLVFTERNGIGCCRCTWGSTCDGCEVSRDGHVVLSEADTLCVTFESLLSPLPPLMITASTSPTPSVTDWPADPLPQPSTTLIAAPEVVEHESLATASLDEPRPLNLETCLEAFIANECLNDGDGDNLWFCGDCQVLRAATKSLHIMSSPKTLIVYLKRFLFVANTCHKLSESVHYPIDTPLDMTPMVANATRPLLYRLSALVCHSGTAQTGHYTAYVKDQRLDQWLYYNDDVVTRESPKDTDCRAYILFYSRCDEPAVAVETMAATATAAAKHTADQIIDPLAATDS